VFDEADWRDPDHKRRWVALVDGNNHQIDRIEAEAAARGTNVAVVVDLIHVLEYLWGSVWCFFAEGDPDAETWVHNRAMAVLEGNAREVAAGIRRRATTAGLSRQERIKADACAKYLTNKAAHLDYPTALAAGWPVASGVIEGTCRYLVADRMVFSSREPVHFCPVGRLTVLVGYSLASYRLPRAELSPAGPSSVSHRAARRTRLLERRRRRVQHGGRRRPVPVRPAFRPGPGGVHHPRLRRRAGALLGLVHEHRAQLGAGCM
ncbi:MAG: hypothetical protein ACRDZY_01030, partial [Acidimicrobiales bacterium]